MHPELTAKQHQAIEMISTGAKLCNIAETLGIDRQTLWRWRQNPQFRAALDAHHAQLRAEISDQYTELLRLAFVSLHRQLLLADDPKRINPFREALEVLKLFQPARLFHDPPP